MIIKLENVLLFIKTTDENPNYDNNLFLKAISFILQLSYRKIEKP